MSAAPGTARAPSALRYLLVSVVLFGGIWPVTKDALRHATPLWFAFGRAAMAGLAAVLLLALLGRLRSPAPRDWPTVLTIGLLQLGLFFALAHLALERLPAGRTGILGNVTVFWLVPLSLWLLGEAVSARRWAAVALGLAGAVVLIAPWDVRAAPGALGGYAMLLGASLAWSLAIIATRRWPPASPVLELLPWCFGLGAILLLPLALWQEPAGGIGMPVWPHAAFVGAVAAPLGTWATIEAGRRLSGVTASLGFLLIPMLGLTLSTLWLGEPLGLDLLLGSALIVGGVALAARG